MRQSIPDIPLLAGFIKRTQMVLHLMEKTMNDNDDTNNVVHLITNNEEVEEISAEEKSRQSVVEVLEEMLELAKAGDIKEFVAASVDSDGDACIHISSADYLGAVGLYETGKHIFLTQYHSKLVD